MARDLRLGSERGEFAAGQFLEGFNVFLRSLFRHFGWEFGCGRGFIPVERFEIVANKLLVEARGIAPSRP